MMMNNVVKSSQLAAIFSEFNAIIHSDITNRLCRKRTQDFTRNRNMNFYSLIYYFIFRNRTTTNAELSHFYSSIDRFEKRISKQALNKAIRKLNPNVFSYLINRFSAIYYTSSLPKKYRGYFLIAEDGTYMEIPYNVYNIYDFHFVENQHIIDMFDVKKVQSKAGGLYDVLNGLFIDFSLKPAPYSELPLAFSHLYRSQSIFKGKDVIYLADRYYGSAEIISHLECIDYHYIIRGKSNFYKKQVALMKSDDEWIEVEIDEKWRRRFRFSPEAMELRENNPVMKIRVIKRRIEYINNHGEACQKELIFFTNLGEEFSAQEIIELYTYRWDIEVSYKTLKTDQEIERHISSDGDVARNDIYAKVLFHNIAGIMRKELNRSLEMKESNRQYVVNIAQLHEIIHDVNILLSMINGKKRQLKKKIEQIEKMLDKIKVPVRPNRHYQRWGRVMISPPSYRFRLDGRNNPKVRRYKSVLMTISP